MNTPSSSTTPKRGLLPCAGPGHHIPPKNRHGIIAIHSYPPEGRMTLREFKGFQRIMDAIEPALQAERAKPVILSAEESAELKEMLARNRQ